MKIGDMNAILQGNSKSYHLIVQSVENGHCRVELSDIFFGDEKVLYSQVLGPKEKEEMVKRILMSLFRTGDVRIEEEPKT